MPGIFYLRPCAVHKGTRPITSSNKYDTNLAAQRSQFICLSCQDIHQFLIYIHIRQCESNYGIEFSVVIIPTYYTFPDEG